MARFFHDASRGSAFGHSISPIPIDFFTITLTNRINLAFVPAIGAGYKAGGRISYDPLVRIMNALGSEANDDQVLLLDDWVNNFKTEMWKSTLPDDVDTEYHVSDSEALDRTGEYLGIMSGPIVVCNYLRRPRVWGNFLQSYREVRAELTIARTHHWVRTGRFIPIVEAWSGFMNLQMIRVRNNTIAYVRHLNTKCQTKRANDASADATTFKANARAMLAKAEALPDFPLLN